MSNDNNNSGGDLVWVIKLIMYQLLLLLLEY
jgi:hypothetical protein